MFTTLGISDCSFLDIRHAGNVESELAPDATEADRAGLEEGVQKGPYSSSEHQVEEPQECKHELHHGLDEPDDEEIGETHDDTPKDREEDPQQDDENIVNSSLETRTMILLHISHSVFTIVCKS